MSGDGDDREDMFKPLNDAERRKAKLAGPSRKKTAPQPIVPVPTNVDDPVWHGLSIKDVKNAPAAHWPYHTEDGARAFHVARWDPEKPGERKIIRPITWCRLPDGREGWALKAMPAPRPLYKLPDILESTSRSAVVVEGEKYADAAGQVFPDCVVTTWAGGTNAWAETDWQQLAAREILLVADADRPGRAAMRELAAHLAAMGCTVRLFLPTGNTSYDIADAVEQLGLEGRRDQIEAQATLWEPKVTGPPKEAEVNDAPFAGEATNSPDTGEAPDAPDNGDWIEKLLERARRDLGAAFESEILEKFIDLQSANTANWMRLRARLRTEAKVPLGSLDKALKKKGEELNSSSLRGRILEWPEVEPWPEELDGPELLRETVKLITCYVDMSEAQAVTVALWLPYSWLHPLWDVSTFLAITSATKRCGKSLLLEVIEEFAPRPLNLGGHTTSAALFRTIEEYGPTILLDEADTYLGDDNDLRGLINGSQRRSSAQALRMVKVGDNWKSACFGTFCPKVIAGIGSLPGTIRDRSLRLELLRRAADTPEMPYWGDRDKDETKAIRQKMTRWTQDNAALVHRPRPDVHFPSGLHDRARDAWTPLLSIAERAGGEWAGDCGRAWRACEAITAATKDETDYAEMLLADIRQVFHDAGDPPSLPTDSSEDHYAPHEHAILPALIEMVGRPWSEYSRNRPLSPRGLARLLSRFKISPSTIRLASGSTRRGYKRDSFVPIWKRYDIRDPENSPDSGG